MAVVCTVSSNKCFVIMPYGIKKDVDGVAVNFDEVYEWIIKKAVESVPDLACERCDDIDLPGSIHERMIRHIFEDRVAIVDTSSLNANVFYELGVRHALKKSITVLIHRKGTTWPFNIAGLSSIEYEATLGGASKAIDKIATFIKNALSDSTNVDSLVYNILPQLNVQAGPATPPKRITKPEIFEYPLRLCPGKSLCLITGDREQIKVADIWANSENTEMQMDRYYGTSTSATIRYLGAKKHPTSGRVIEDTISNELVAMMGTELQVEPATVVCTGPGELIRNNVKHIFHVAAVVGEAREGYRPIDRIERCVTNALRYAELPLFAVPLTSIILPIFGTGPASGDFKTHSERCFNAALDYLESNPAGSISHVYFYVWTDQDLIVCRDVLKTAAGQNRVPPQPK